MSSHPFDPACAHPTPPGAAQNATYLGGGAYATIENGMLKLMANDHRLPTDAVFLESPDALRQLIDFTARVGWLPKDTNGEDT